MTPTRFTALIVDQNNFTIVSCSKKEEVVC